MQNTNKYFLGIDIGGTTIKAGIVDEKGHIIEKRSEITPGSQDNTAFLNTIDKIIDFLISRHGLPVSAGIGSPGPIDNAKGMILSSANMPAIRNLKIIEHISAKLNTTVTKIPVLLDNDANCATLGEYYFGSGKGEKNFAVFTLGTGVGGGLVINDSLFQGYQGNAFEIGHIPIAEESLQNSIVGEINMPLRRCGCGAIGCLETLASATSVAEMYHYLQHEGKPPLATTSEKLSAAEIAKKARENDQNAKTVFYYAGVALGLAVTTVVQLVNVPLIIFTGGMAQASDLLEPHISQIVDQRIFPIFKNRLKIVFTKQNLDSGILGAAALSLNLNPKV